MLYTYSLASILMHMELLVLSLSSFPIFVLLIAPTIVAAFHLHKQLVKLFDYGLQRFLKLHMA